MIGTLKFGENTLIHTAHAGTIKTRNVECFLDRLLATDNGLPTVIVLDNASIHHGIDDATRQRWLLEHKVILFHLLVHSPEPNMVKIVWRHLKCRWRRALTWWTRESIDAELAAPLVALLSKYGPDF